MSYQQPNRSPAGCRVPDARILTSEPPTASRTTDATTRAARSLCTTAACGIRKCRRFAGRPTHCRGLDDETSHLQAARVLVLHQIQSFSRQNELESSSERRYSC